MLSIFFWVLIFLMVIGNGYWGLRPAGDRLWMGVGFGFVILLILLGLKVFPVAW